MIRRPRSSTLFPSTPLFQSNLLLLQRGVAEHERALAVRRLAKVVGDRRSQGVDADAMVQRRGLGIYALRSAVAYDFGKKIGRAHVLTPVTVKYPKPASSLKK